MDDWKNILEFLQPKESPYCPEAASLTQKVFLRTYSLEALFGGAAGGGKSSALLMAALQYVDVPGYSAILFRRTYADLALPGAIMDRFQAWIANYDNIKWNGSLYVATFPSGARISFGYLNNSQDYLRYKGAEFQFIVTSFPGCGVQYPALFPRFPFGCEQRPTPRRTGYDNALS